MSDSDPGPSWRGVFSKTAAQGSSFNAPLSPSGQYYGYLSKVDFNASTSKYDVFFELMPYEWAENVIFAPREDVPMMAPVSPATAYHIPAVSESAILNALGLKTADDLAEGSWYLLTLAKGDDKEHVTGDLYDPDIDTIPGG